MSEFVIYVKLATKRRLIRQAAEGQRSLCAEVVLALLEGYKPAGWEAAHAEVLRRTRLFNNRAEVVADGALETIGLDFPPGLRAELERAARRERRSLNAEITRFLEGGKDE